MLHVYRAGLDPAERQGRAGKDVAAGVRAQKWIHMARPLAVTRGGKKEQSEPRSTKKTRRLIETPPNAGNKFWIGKNATPAW